MKDTREKFLKDGETLPDPIVARQEVIDASIGAATVALSHFPSVHSQNLAPIVGAPRVETIFADRRATQLGVAARAVDAEVQAPDVAMTNDQYLDQLADDVQTSPEVAAITELRPAVSAALDSTVDTSELNQPQAA